MINMGYIEKEALTPDNKLTFTSFLQKRFLAADFYIRNQRDYLSDGVSHFSPMVIT